MCDLQAAAGRRDVADRPKVTAERDQALCDEDDEVVSADTGPGRAEGCIEGVKYNASSAAARPARGWTRPNRGSSVAVVEHKSRLPRGVWRCNVDGWTVEASYLGHLCLMSQPHLSPVTMTLRLITSHTESISLIRHVDAHQFCLVLPLPPRNPKNCFVGRPRCLRAGRPELLSGPGLNPVVDNGGVLRHDTPSTDRMNELVRCY